MPDGNMIYSFLRGMAMAENPEYAKRVYAERDLQKRVAAAEQMKRTFSNPNDANRWQAILDSGDLANADYLVKDTAPSSGDFRYFSGADGQMYSFDANRDTYHPMGDIKDPRYNLEYQTNLANNKAEANAMNKMWKVQRGNGTYDILSGRQIQNERRMGSDVQVLGEDDGMGAPPAGYAQPQPQGQGMSKGNVTMYTDNPDGNMTPEQRVVAEQAMGMLESGKASPETVMKILDSVGIRSEIKSDEMAQPQQAPAPIPLDGQMHLPPQQPQVQPQQPQQPQQQGQFGVSNQAKLDMANQKEKYKADLRQEVYSHNKQVDADVKRHVELINKQLPRNQVTYLTNRLRSIYEELRAAGGMVDAEQSTLSNLPKGIASTTPGQYLGGKVGTYQQRLRDEVTAIRSLLLKAITSANNTSATQMNSNVELDFYAQAATDPTKEYHQTMNQLDVINDMFGEKAEEMRTRDTKADTRRYNNSEKSYKPVDSHNGLEILEEVPNGR